jgi:carboxymethylenebutenolidase
MGKMIAMTMSDGKAVGVYHAEPHGVRRGGLVVIQEIFGITDHIKDVAESYCKEGYEVLAPALFDREEPGLNIGADEIQKGIDLAYKRHPFDLSVADAMTCVHALKKNGLVFAVGYCYGGSVTWALAGRDAELTAASSYYGKMAPDMADQKPKCPTICHFGRTDASIPLDAVERMQKMRPETTMYLYDAGHGFNSPRPAHHNAEAAKLARDRTLRFLRANGG